MEGITIIVHIPKSYWYNPSVYIKKLNRALLPRSTRVLFLFSVLYSSINKILNNSYLKNEIGVHQFYKYSYDIFYRP